MYMPWLLLLASIAMGQEVHEIVEEMTLNTTTLYPVTSKILDVNKNHRNLNNTHENGLIKTNVTKEDDIQENNNVKDKVEVASPLKEKVTKWRIDVNYAPSKDKPGHDVHPINKEGQDNNADSKQNENEESNNNKSNKQNSVEKYKDISKEKEFKPSPHLGSFFDDENLNILKFSTPDSVVYPRNKPAGGTLGFKDTYALDYKSPKDTHRDQIEAPYRFEKAHFLTTNYWKQSLESKPTVESSVKIPAGDLYKHSDPFKDSPSLDDDNYGLGFNEDERETENPMKKRSNPWKSFVQLVTAFLPVGLIISALTPSVVTLHSTDNDPYLSRGARRADAGAAAGTTLAAMPAISEDCRRRLLCEIHSEENYVRSPGRPRVARKHCYKLHCEAPHALRSALAWLLAHGQAARLDPRPAPRPGPVAYQRHRSHDYT